MGWFDWGKRDQQNGLNQRDPQTFASSTEREQYQAGHNKAREEQLRQQQKKNG